MVDEIPEDPGDVPEEGPDIPAKELPEVKMGPAFYASLALIGILVLMVIVLNYPAAQLNSGTAITQSNWTLQSLMDNTGILIPARSGTEVTAMFDREGRLSGSAGCNGYTSGYQARDYSINITGTASTKMFCGGPGVMEQESAFLVDLSKVSSFRFSGSSLKFYDASGKTVLVFVPG